MLVTFSVICKTEVLTLGGATTETFEITNLNTNLTLKPPSPDEHVAIIKCVIIPRHD